MTVTRRIWNTVEIEEAAQYVRSKRPDVWEKLEEIERETGDLNGEEAADIEAGLLFDLHPGIGIMDMSSLQLQLRIKRGLV